MTSENTETDNGTGESPSSFFQNMSPGDKAVIFAALIGAFSVVIAAIISLCVVFCLPPPPPTPTYMPTPTYTPTHMPTPTLTPRPCFDDCMIIDRVTIDGQSLIPWQEFHVSEGDELRIDTITYSVTEDDLNTLRYHVSNSGSVSVEAFLVINGTPQNLALQVTPPDEALTNLTSAIEESLSVKGGEMWTVPSSSQNVTIVIQVIYDPPPSGGYTEVIARIEIPLEIN